VRTAVTPKKRGQKSPRPQRQVALRGMGGTDTKYIENLIGRGGPGGAWAFKALDPCAEQEEGGLRIPDKTATDTACLEGRADLSVTAPAAVPSDGHWDCLLVSMPLPEAPIWYWTRVSGTDTWTAQPQFIFTPGLTGADLDIETGVNYGSLKTIGPTLGQNGDAFRTTYKGFSVIHDSSDLHNEGRVFAGQIRAPPFVGTEPGPDGGPAFTRKFFTFGKIPQDTSALLSSCTEMVRFKAREGIYVPQRFNQPKHAFTSTDWRPLSVGSNPKDCEGLFSLRYAFVDQTGAATQTVTVNGYSPNSDYVVSGADNTQMGVAFFMGIHKESTLDIKLRQCEEVQVAPASPWSFFAEPTPLPDEAAIRDVAIIMDELNVAYPERYNSFGALIPLIGQAVSALVGWGAGKVTNWLSRRYGKKTAEKRLIYQDEELD